MRKYVKTLQALVATTIVLSALVGTASANRRSTSSRNIRATWTALEFIDAFGTTVRCPLTLEGSLHSAVITKTLGALIGHITRGTINSAGCAAGGFTILQANLPWHVRYNGFQGTLPNITAVRTTVINMAFRLQSPSGTCLFLTTATQPLSMQLNRAAGGGLTSAVLSGTITSSEACVFGARTNISLAGTSATLTQLGLAGGITVTLI